MKQRVLWNGGLSMLTMRVESVRLRQQLKIKLLSVTDLSKQSSISQTTLYKILGSEDTEVSMKTIQKLCRALDVEPCELG